MTGTAPEGASITYGTDTINDSPPGSSNLGGMETPIPWSGVLPYSSSAMFWYVDAQLGSTGAISCAVVAQIEVFYSNGTHRTQQKTIATGQASGDYNICSAESA